MQGKQEAMSFLFFCFIGKIIKGEMIRGMIKLSNVSKVFNLEKTKIEAVKDVSIHIREEEIFGIIGFSGAGKSTLVRCINMLEHPTEGSVMVAGEELTTLSKKNLRIARKKIGMIFQQFNLMPSRTVFENVAYPLKNSGFGKKEIINKVRALLELVDISEKENAYPSQLSGGQKQRVAIARALANEPKVLLCDEATSALDPKTTGSILQLLKKLNKQLGLTIVIITHEMDVVKEICDKAAIMENGRVVEQGDVFSIFSIPQMPITEEFIRSTSSLQKVDKLIEEGSQVVALNKGNVIVKFTYVQKDVSESLVSTLSRKFDIDLNIIFAEIEIVQEAPIGGTVVIISGEAKNIEQALKYAIGKNVKVEVIADARVVD